MGCSCTRSSIKILKERYEKLEKIGKGGFSKIYRAKRGDREYAMK